MKVSFKQWANLKHLYLCSTHVEFCRVPVDRWESLTINLKSISGILRIINNTSRNEIEA